MSRAAGSGIFDALERGLIPLAASRPRQAFALAAGLGRLRNRLSRRWPGPEQIHALFPELGARAAARVAWSVGGLEARNRLAVELVRRAGLEPLRPLVRTPDSFAALRPPLILGTFHAGAVHAIGPALERLPAPVLALRQGPLFAPRPPLEVATTEGDEQSRAALFHRAVEHLGRGGFVAMALDVAPGAGLRATCLGRPLVLARGPFALARLTGAPIVPLVARWRGGGVEIVVAPHPLGPPSAGREPEREEVALASSAARWLESYLLASPAEIGLGLLRALLGRDLTGS